MNIYNKTLTEYQVGNGDSHEFVGNEACGKIGPMWGSENDEFLRFS